MSSPTLLVSIGADFSQFDKDMKDIGRHLKPFQDVLNNVGSTLTKTITVPLAAVVAAFGASAVKTGKFGDEILKMSDKTGLSTTRLQELKYVASQANVEFSAITQAVGMLTRKLFSADQEGQASTKILKQLGVNVKDTHGNFRSMNDIFPEVISRLANVGNETERNALASQIFGRGFQEMAGLLKLSGTQLEDYISKSHELGLVMSKEGIQTADNFDDKLDELKQQFGSLVREIGTALIPVLMTGLIPAIQRNVIPALKTVIGFVAGVVKGFGQLPGGVQVAIVAIVGIAAAFGPLLLGLAKFVSLMPSVISAFVALGTAVPWLVALAVVVGILGGAWLKMKVQQAEGTAATKAMNDEMVRQAETLGNLKNKDLPAYIEGLKQIIVNAKAAKAAIEAKYQPSTRTVRSDREGNVYSVTTPAVVSKEDAAELQRLGLLIQGTTATVEKFTAAKKEGVTASKSLTDQEQAVGDVMTELSKQLDLATKRHKLFWNEEEFTKQKSDALRTAIEGLLTAGIDPMDRSIKKLVDDLIKVEHPMEKLKGLFDKTTTSKWDPGTFDKIPVETPDSPQKMLQNLRRQKEEEKRIWMESNQFEMGLIDTLTTGINSAASEWLMVHRQAKSAWDQIWISMENTAISSLAAIVTQWITNQIIGAALQTAATAGAIASASAVGAVAIPAAYAMSVLTFGGAAGIGTGAYLAGLAGVELASMPRLAQGGLAYGPSAVIVGDNPGASTDPELIAPLSKILGAGGTQKVEVFGTIKGRDIYLTGQNYKNGMGRQ